MQNQHIHILGICGTFMAGVAQLAQALGYRVSGCDQNIYPPMSEQLANAGVELLDGYKPEHLDACNSGLGADLVVIGNAMSRGNPVVEAVLNRGLPYTSGPQWLAENVLQGRWVLAVAGTHGKTTCSSMLAWILEAAGLQPGYLIGGVPVNLPASARLGNAPFFVIEADEYDTAFFDKRSKFVHYRPRTLILNNLEYDHADIFPDLAAIQRQFHHLVRTVPGEGLIIVNAAEHNLSEVLNQGCWTARESFALADFSADWQISDEGGQSNAYAIALNGEAVGTGFLQQPGRHNQLNALAAIIAARHAGVRPADAIAALREFRGVKRRLEVIYNRHGITVYDDFAHHPTAISATLAALRTQAGSGKVLVLLELRSNTMRMGVHNVELQQSLAAADYVWVYKSANVAAGLERQLSGDSVITDDLDQLLAEVVGRATAGDHIVLMSNGGFDGAHAKLLSLLQQVDRQ